LKLLRNTLLAEKWEAEIDGLGFRYTGLSKSEKTLSLTLEDEWVALLKEKKGYVSVKRENSTRAEFIKRLVEEAAPGLDFYCPQLHRKQPIGNKKEAKEAKEEAREHRGKGIGDQKHLKVKGQSPTAPQKELAETALRIAESLNAPFVVQVALIAALIDETDMGAVDSGNVLEAIGSGGAEKGNAATEIKNFLTGSGGYGGGGAIGYHKAHPSATYYEIAQGVQRSGAGESSNGRANYGQFGEESREWVEAYAGGESGSLSIPEPFRFEVKKKETYWAAIKRLAKEVNWRAFIVLDVFYFMPEPELISGEVRLAIDPDTDGIENVDFEYNVHGDVTEVTVTALVAQWKPPPGSVVTLEGYGPASLGPGDPAHKKGEPAIASAVKASTHEGRGRYLVSSIEVPLSNDPAQRMATITLKTPTKPLPEKRPARKSVSGTPGSSDEFTLGDTSVPGHPELKPGISEVVNAILKKFPGLQITSTTTGDHAENSYHYLGRAADLAAGDYGLMNEAAAWINESGLWEHLTEGIHNPGSGSGPSLLSVKEGKKVPSSFWGAETWAAHENHIHVAV
jgi:hypothetical protein